MAGASASVTSATTDAGSIDGRRARAERSREAVVTAILELIDEGVGVPAGAAVADRAGVSLRSIFRHFDDLESLYVAAIDRHAQRVDPLFAAPSAKGDLAERIDALVASRSRLYEGIAPVRRVAEQLRNQSGAIAQRLLATRKTLVAQLPAQFGGELARFDDGDRRELLAAIESATSWATWNELRVDQRCSVARAEAVVRRTLRALLEAERSGRARGRR
jgi:TetR/AcrR family transcriptional regulator, regulator of autoinduction and epiphytic fitness